MKDKYLRKLNIELVDGEFENPIKEQVRTPEQLHKIFKSIKNKNQETLIGVYLSDHLEVNAYQILSTGSEQETIVATDEVFDLAIVTRSRTFILIHNHPKGDPSPSESDKELMKVIKEYAPAVRRTFLDFIIVGEDSYWSMFEDANGGEYSLGAIT